MNLNEVSKTSMNSGLLITWFILSINILRRTAKIRSNILIISLILLVVCFVGCKKKTNPPKAEAKSPNPNITQQITVDKNAVSPNIPAKAEERQIVATVNGINIYKDDFNKRVAQQINPVQRQMPANFFEQYKKELDKRVSMKQVKMFMSG